MLNYFNMLLRNALRGYLSFNYRFNVMDGTVFLWSHFATLKSHPQFLWSQFVTLKIHHLRSQFATSCFQPMSSIRVQRYYFFFKYASKSLDLYSER